VADNRQLYKAKQQKKDEFYTQLADIENELRHYKPHFNGKTVYCNCDDPYESNFFKYFASNFNALGLRRLLATSYAGSPVVGEQLSLDGIAGLAGEGNGGTPHMIDIREVSDVDGDGAVALSDVEWLLRNDANTARRLKGDGDFRSPECVALLKQADVVVTNPPFSLFREYIAQLVEHGKQFLILGNKNSVTTKEVFPLICGGRLWMGHTPMGRDLLFDIPQELAETLVSTKKEGSGYKMVGGRVMGRSASCWFTNLDHSKRHEELILYREYTPEDYPQYDNFNAIEVGKTKDIPADWDGVMGVPITFLDKHNPDQFEIVGITKTWFGAATKTYPKQVQVGTGGKRSDVTKLNDGAALQIDGPVDKTHYIVDGKYYVQTFPRILICRKGFGSVR